MGQTQIMQQDKPGIFFVIISNSFCRFPPGTLAKMDYRANDGIGSLRIRGREESHLVLDIHGRLARVYSSVMRVVEFHSESG